MAALPKRLALDTNVPLDLADDKDFAHDFRETFQDRGYALVVPPTVVTELTRKGWDYLPESTIRRKISSASWNFRQRSRHLRSGSRRAECQNLRTSTSFFRSSTR